MPAQLELVIASPALQLLADNQELLLDALEDASAYRENMEDIPSADAYQTLAAQIERLMTVGSDS